jgi:hypothetical protein
MRQFNFCGNFNANKDYNINDSVIYYYENILGKKSDLFICVKPL